MEEKTLIGGLSDGGGKEDSPRSAPSRNLWPQQTPRLNPPVGPIHLACLIWPKTCFTLLRVYNLAYKISYLNDHWPNQN